MALAINFPTAEFVTSSLSGVLAAGATSATIGTGLNIPATNGVLQISYDTANAVGATDGPETITYTTYTTATGALAGLVRGCAGTTDVQHSSGQSVQQGSSVYHLTGELGYAEITSNFTTSSAVGTTLYDVTGLSVTVTVPTGGRRIKITAFASSCTSSQANSNAINLYIREGSTILSKAQFITTSSPYGGHNICFYSAVPTSGAHTYKVSYSSDANGNLTMEANTTWPAFILVEQI